MSDRAAILATAEELVNGERARTYGDAKASFQRVADLWNAMGFRTAHARAEGHEPMRKLEAADVALALAQLKVSRIISSPDHEDSWVDLAGYAALGGEIATT